MPLLYSSSGGSWLRSIFFLRSASLPVHGLIEFRVSQPCSESRATAARASRTGAFMAGGLLHAGRAEEAQPLRGCPLVMHPAEPVEPDRPPVGGVGEERAQDLVVQRMAGAVADEPAAQPGAGERQVADRVQQLVADELVLHAQ